MVDGWERYPFDMFIWQRFANMELWRRKGRHCFSMSEENKKKRRREIECEL